MILASPGIVKGGRKCQGSGADDEVEDVDESSESRVLGGRVRDSRHLGKL